MILTLSFCFFLVSCAAIPIDRYNTQKGAVIGAGAGALIGQALGGNTEGTLIGLAAGTIFGALVGNAVDAIGEDGGAVRVVTRRLAPEELVQIEIADDGCGISEENVRNLFKVFFSTKGSKGTGLGLAVTQKVIHEHGGTIDVESQLGVGTTFRIRLPLRPPDVAATDAAQG